MTTITNQDAANKMIRARIDLLVSEPFFGTLALRLELIERTDLNPPTMATDGKRIYYHPEFVMERDFAEVKFIIAHEVGHCIFEHMARRGARQPKKWNFAGDYVVNAVLVDSGFKMVPGGLHHPGYAGMTADQVYEMLPDDNGNDPNDPSDQYDNVIDADPGVASEISTDWQLATVQAANAARQAGKLSGSLERFVDQLVASKTDWRARLRQFATEITKNDYSYQRINRRYASLGFYLPGLYSEGMGTMVVVTDDSGSIGQPVLNAFAAEIDSIRQAVHPQRLIVISCDAAINHIDDLTDQDPFEMKCHGGGGTDFRPPFEWLEKEGIVPSCFIYLTDLYGPCPEQAPPYPVLWCCISNEKAPWGETLKVEV